MYYVILCYHFWGQKRYIFRDEGINIVELSRFRSYELYLFLCEIIIHIAMFLQSRLLFNCIRIYNLKFKNWIIFKQKIYWVFKLRKSLWQVGFISKGGNLKLKLKLNYIFFIRIWRYYIELKRAFNFSYCILHVNCITKV